MSYTPIVLDGLGFEARSIENPQVPVSAASFLEFFGISSDALPALTPERALAEPTVSAAVGFLSRTMANLPLHAFRTTEAGPERLGGKLQRVLNEAPNPEWSSFAARQYMWQQVFSRGRGLMYIERLGSAPDTLWPMDAAKTTVKRVAGRKVYQYGGRTYAATDVIDVPFMLKDDQLGVRSPINLAATAIQLSLAMSKYAAGFFAGGGVPPLALVGPLPVGAEAMKRALADQRRAIDAAREAGSAIFPTAPGYELKPVGFDPAKGQMVEAKQHLVVDILRPFGLPPVFVGDLSHGTFANTEQQDLQLAKHTVAHWSKALEDELNLKLFGATNNRRYVEHSLDGLMRGDFKTRMEALSRAVQTALLTPDEARELENRPPMPGGNRLYVQGATVPLETQTQGGAAGPAVDGGQNVS